MFGVKAEIFTGIVGAMREPCKSAESAKIAQVGESTPGASLPYSGLMPHRPSMVDFEAVLFDVDGTLIDSLFCIAEGLGDAIDRFTGARPDSSDLRNLIGLPLLKQMELYSKDPAEIPAMANFAIERMRFHSGSDRPFDGAVECLKRCHTSGIKTALVTSKNAEELAAFLPNFLHRSYVDTAVCASDVLHPKPSPESAYLACKRINVSPTKCAFVGDSIYDMRCGRSAGMVCVAVAYGAGSREALEAEMPDLLFETPDALLAWAHESLSYTPCHEKK